VDEAVSISCLFNDIGAVLLLEVGAVAGLLVSLGVVMACELARGRE
jgi:hypothetical protein